MEILQQRTSAIYLSPRVVKPFGHTRLTPQISAQSVGCHTGATGISRWARRRREARAWDDPRRSPVAAAAPHPRDGLPPS